MAHTPQPKMGALGYGAPPVAQPFVMPPPALRRLVIEGTSSVVVLPSQRAAKTNTNQPQSIVHVTPRGSFATSPWSLAGTSSWKSGLSPSLVDPKWSSVATLGHAIGDELHPMCLDNLSASMTNQPNFSRQANHHFDRREWEVARNREATLPKPSMDNLAVFYGERHCVGHFLGQFLIRSLNPRFLHGPFLVEDMDWPLSGWGYGLAPFQLAMSTGPFLVGDME